MGEEARRLGARRWAEGRAGESDGRAAAGRGHGRVDAAWEVEVDGDVACQGGGREEDIEGREG